MNVVVTPEEAVNQSVYFILQNPGTAGARAMARVLLHAYNHTEQSLDIADLCVLDEAGEEWAWAILQARVRGSEPQEFCSNKEMFEAVVKEYLVVNE